MRNLDSPHDGIKGTSAYTAAKHGVIGLTKTAALEYMKLGIRVNAISPGFIDTAMVDRGLGGTGDGSDKLYHRLRKKIVVKALTLQQPARRMGSPEEVAQAVRWLCSESASFVNGHTVVVDGGYLAM